MNLTSWLYLLGFFIVGWGVSIGLQPFQSTPHVRLCNLQKECQNILLVIDTGSTDLWLSDFSCKTCPKMSVKCLPEPIIHNSFQESPGKWVPLKQKEIQYGIGWVKGYEVDYKVCGIITKVLCVTSSKDVEHFGSHGVLGIGGNSTGADFLGRLIQGFNATKSISVFFGSYFTELTIGGFNYDYINKGAEIQYYNTTVDWTLEATNVKMGLVQFKERIVALVDSGSSMLVLPEEMFNRAFDQVSRVIKNICSRQQYGIVCSCADPSWVNKFPAIQISFQHDNSIKNYRIPNNLYVTWEKGLCIAEVTSLKKYDGILILGRPFLKQYITVFDMQLNRIGIIEANLMIVKKAEKMNMGVLIASISLVVIIGCKLMVTYFLKLNE